MKSIVVDAAGGAVGGAARWASELDAFLLSYPAPVTVIGRHRRLTPRWMVQREAAARGAGMTVAANNVSFMFAGAQRRVLLRNPLHFVYPSEEHLLARMPRSLRAQIPVVHRLVARADTLVVPSQAMANRVCRHLPSVRDRIRVRHHPLTPTGQRQPSEKASILVPVFLSPYKNVVPQLEMLLSAIDRLDLEIEVCLTATSVELPPAIACHPKLKATGHLRPDQLAELWHRATAVFFPCTLESFGYPFAEARAHGVPVLSPETDLAREVAGSALLAYDPQDVESLMLALSKVDEPVEPDPQPFDPNAYFRWLFEAP